MPPAHPARSREAAALLPALWLDIDCDDDPARREAGLEPPAKLRTRRPRPSWTAAADCTPTGS
ncbi:MAG: hypothetical protein IPK19_37930 [Chloroflexi bacterium]|nr:hypothetical protein [Chloroflexota bacterium]